MIDNMIFEELKNSLGKTIVFWNFKGLRHEGKLLDVSEDYLKFFDIHKDVIRFCKLENILEVEIQ